MSRADLLRSLSAPPELIEAELVDQLADASASLARLRARTPDDHDPAWSRHYSEAQNLYHKALSALLKFRRAAPAVAPLAEPPTSAPTTPAPAPRTPTELPRPPLDLSHLTPRQRRQLDSLRRAAPGHRPCQSPSIPSHHHPDPPNPPPSRPLGRSPAR